MKTMEYVQDAGWMIDNKNGIVWHNGATSNFNCYIGFDKENQTGVVILSNLPPDYRVPATVMRVELLGNPVGILRISMGR